MTTFTITIPAAWLTAASSELRESYSTVAGAVSSYVEKHDSWSREQAAKRRVLMRKLEDALDQVGWSWDRDQNRPEDDAQLTADDGVIGVALRGVLWTAADWDLRSCEYGGEHGEKLLNDGRLTQLATMLQSMTAAGST